MECLHFCHILKEISIIAEELPASYVLDAREEGLDKLVHSHKFSL